MAVRSILSLSEMNAIIRQPKLTVVDFTAVWCGPCKSISPHFSKLAEEKKNCNFLKVDVDQAQEIAAEYRVRAMPTFMFFKAGQKVDSFEGADINRLQTLVRQHETAEVAPIPTDAELNNMTPKEILAVMKAHHISADGLLEKSEFIDTIKKHR
jgi:thioredoxin 1